MSVTPASIKLKFPEFSSISDATVQSFIDDSEFDLDPGVWNVYMQNGVYVRDLGQSWLVASMLFINVVNAGGGKNMQNAAPVNNKTADKLSTGYAVNAIDASDTDALLESNKYGQRYLQIRNSIVQGLSNTATVTLNITPLLGPNVAL